MQLLPTLIIAVTALTRLILAQSDSVGGSGCLLGYYICPAKDLTGVLIAPGGTIPNGPGSALSCLFGGGPAPNQPPESSLCNYDTNQNLIKTDANFNPARCPKHDVCTNCAPGYGLGGDKVCQKCKGHEYSKGGTKPCAKCPAGYVPTSDHADCHKKTTSRRWVPVGEPEQH